MERYTRQNIHSSKGVMNMNRLTIDWMGHYYEVKDGDTKVGEICYGMNTKKGIFRSDGDKNFGEDFLQQLLTFIQRENESNHSYA